MFRSLLARVFGAEFVIPAAAAAAINEVAEERRLELLHEDQRGELDARESDQGLAW